MRDTLHMRALWFMLGIEAAGWTSIRRWPALAWPSC